MAKKTTVTITCADGEQRTHSGDTVIAYTVSDLEKVMAGESNETENHVMIIGKRFPEPMVDVVIGNMICNIVETLYKDNPVLAAASLNCISRHLRKREEELTENMTEDDANKATIHLLSSLIGDLLK